jgi:hypothetical protein
LPPLPCVRRRRYDGGVNVAKRSTWRVSVTVLLASAFGACAVACDPTYGVEGTVRDATGAPLAGATVTKTCPKGAPETETTVADGRFSFGGVGGSFEASACTLIVEAPGHTARTLHTYDVCYHNTEDRSHRTWPCTAGKGDVKLTK